MIVINKRYYDYDYDNNTIIMFDAEDEHDSSSPSQFASNPLADKKESHSSSMLSSTARDRLESQSQSTETVPDDLIKVASSMSKSSSIAADSAANNHNDAECVHTDKEKEEEKESSNSNSNSPADGNLGSVSWIASHSPKGSRRIPYAIQIAHSYTINKLEVQLTTLVDVATIHKQQEQQLRAYQQQQYEYHYHQQQQQQLQREHEQLLAAQHYEYQQRLYRGHGHAQPPLPRHAHAHAHAHAARGGAMHAAHVHAQHRPRYPPPRDMAGVAAVQLVPDGIAYVGHRATQRYPPPPRHGHTMRPVLVQKDRYHAK